MCYTEGGLHLRNVWIFTFGIILVFGGLVFIALANLPGNPVRETVSEARDGGTWEISGSFKKGEELIIEYSPHTSWRGPPFETTDEFRSMALRIVILNVTNPLGGSTLFSVYLSPYTRGDQPPDPYGELGAVKIWVAPDMPNEGVQVSSNVTLDELRGTVKYDGVHTLQVLEPYPVPLYTPDNPGPIMPPAYLGLRREYLVYPTAYLFPVGGGISVLGAVLSAWALRNPKHQTRDRKKRKV